jgi:outer membrane protein
MGYQEDQEFAVVDEAPPERASPVEELVLQALRDRPDLAALNLETESLEIFAKAEKRLRNPTVTALAAAGVAPVRDQMLRGTYSAAGVDVSIPFLNGGLFKARKEEAELRSNAAAKDVEALAVEVARDVRVAWLATNDAIHRMDVAQRLITEADESLRLAQARYESGLGSIVELTEAQLNQTAAQIEAASAKYDYLSLRAALDYADGSLR